MQLIVLGAGSVFAWYTVVQDFVRFYNFEGTLFKVQNCVFPNPVTTPCFYGAFAFLIGTVWAYAIALDKHRQVRKQKGLVWFLVAGNVFAWANFAQGYFAFLANQSRPTIGCSGQLMGDPFSTPCYVGSVLFLAALVVALVSFAHLRKRALGVNPFGSLDTKHWG